SSSAGASCQTQISLKASAKRTTRTRSTWWASKALVHAAPVPPIKHRLKDEFQGQLYLTHSGTSGIGKTQVTDGTGDSTESGTAKICVRGTQIGMIEQIE